MYNLLASKFGRLAAFFLLYVTEGVPQGFAMIALVTQMKRGGLSLGLVSTFSAWALFPWALKWAAGPFVDVFYSRRLGRRRGWILGCQVMMVATLLVAMSVGFERHFHWFLALLIVHNVFAATQDVAIDALAVQTLNEDERGLASGMMFAGAYTGMALGGAGALFVIARGGVQAGFVYACGAILLVTALVTWHLKEAPAERPKASSLEDVGREIAAFLKVAGRSFVASRAAALGVIFALLPAGAMSLGAAMAQSLSVDLGMSDDKIGTVSLVSGLLSGAGCVVGGWLSDKWGRRISIALFMVLIGVPTAMMAVVMYRYGWVMPVRQGEVRAAPAELVTWWIAMGWAFSFFMGLRYGVQTALYMDVVNPAVAATQFTAYMALQNVVITYSHLWTGWAAGRWGYPTTMAVDAVLGCASIALLPFMTREPVLAPRAVLPLEPRIAAEGEG